jgi:GDP-D-mannose 3',5'-epimerase
VSNQVRLVTHNVYDTPCELSPEKYQVIPALCRKNINYPNEDFIVSGSGKQRRSFVYVDDAVPVLIAVLEKGMEKGVIQIGNKKRFTIGEIARKIVDVSDKGMKIIFDHSKPEGDRDRTADWSKAARILRWAPKVSMDEGLEKTYRWSNTYLTSS